MANFDPAVPTQSDPNWLGWSKAIQQPEPDKSTGIALKTIGEGLKDTAELGGQVVKSQARSGAEDILNQQIDTAETQESLLKGAKPEDLPQDVNRAKQVAENLGSSKANGAMTQTYYLGRLLAYQKDMRSQFPMYRNQIDSGIRDATGVAHTANEYYTHMLQDINSFLTAKDDRAKRALNEAYQGDTYGAPGVKQATQKYQDQPNPQNLRDLEDVIGKARTTDYTRRQAIGNLQLNKDVLSDAKQQSTIVATGIANNIINDHLHTAMNLAGLKDGEDFTDALDTSKHDPQKMQAAFNEYGKMIPRVRAQIDKEFDKPQVYTDPTTGRTIRTSLSQILGSDGNSVKDQAMKRLEDIGSYIKDGQWGAAAYWTNVSKATDQAVKNDLDRSKIGDAIRLSRILKEQNVPEVLQNMIQTAIKNKLGSQFEGVITPMIMKSQLDKASVESTGAQKTTFQQDVDTMVNTVGKSPGGVKALMNGMASIDDPKLSDNAKINRIKYLFDGSNKQVLNTWRQPDQPGAFAAMTSEPITKEVKRLDAQSPGLWNMYKSTISTMADNTIHNQIMELNTIQLNPEYKVKFTDKNPGGGDVYRWDIEPPKTTQIYSKQAYSIAFKHAQQLTESINTVTRRLVDVAKADGVDPTAYIYQTMKNIGYQDVPEGREAQTYPEALAKSLVATRAQQKSNYEKDLQKFQDIEERAQKMQQEKLRPK